MRSLSTEHRNVFQRIYDEIKYLWKSATAGSAEARELEKIKKIFDKVYRESGTVQKNTADDGVRYSLSETAGPLDNYTKKQYNDFGWARYADAITKNELDDMYSKIHEKGSLKKFAQSSDGEAIIEVNDKPHTTLGTDNVFVFVTGTKNNPQINRVARFQFETETEMEIIKENLYERGSFSDTYYSFLKEEGLAREYSKKSALDYLGYNEKVRRGSIGKESNRTDGNSRFKQDRSGTLAETRSNEITLTKKASSKDDVFFDAQNNKNSLSPEGISIAPPVDGYNVRGEDVILAPKVEEDAEIDIAPPVEAEPEISIAPRVESEKSKSVEADEFTEKTLNSFGVERIGDYIHVQRQVFDTLLNEGFFTNTDTRSRTDVNEETGMVIETNKSSICETFNLSNYERLGKFKKVAKLATVRMIPEAIQKGKLISDNVPNQYENSTNKTFAYVSYDTEINGIPVTIKLDVKKTPHKNKLWVHSIVTEKNSTGLDVSFQKGRGGTPYRTDAIGEIIPQEPDIVNTDEATSIAPHVEKDAKISIAPPVDEESSGDVWKEISDSIRADALKEGTTETVEEAKTETAAEKVEEAPRKTVKEKLESKLQNSKNELERVTKLRESTRASYDEKIEAAQSEYASIKNKDSKAANTLAKRIQVSFFVNIKD